MRLLPIFGVILSLSATGWAEADPDGVESGPIVPPEELQEPPNVTMTPEPTAALLAGLGGLALLFFATRRK